MDTEVQSSRSKGMAAIRMLGIALSLLCGFFVIRLLYQRSDLIIPNLGRPGFLLSVVGSAILWVCLNLFLGIGWARLLRLCGSQISLKDSIRITFRTQIAKYLPGNVFHFAGRVALAKRSGVPAKASAGATGLEAMFLVAVASVLSFSVLSKIPGFWWICTVSATVLVAVVFLLRDRFEFLRSSHKINWSQSFQHGAVALIATVMVFVIQTGIFVWLESVLTSSGEISLSDRVELVSASWAAGFVVIGSPGGIGVREYVISLFAGDPETKVRLLTVAAVMRFSSILGDLLSFFIGLTMKSEKDSSNG